MLAMSDDGVAAAAATLLINRGHRVDVASHSRDILDSLKVRDVDAVMLDGVWAAREGLYGLGAMKRQAGRSVRFLLCEEEGAPHAGSYEHEWFNRVLTMPALARDVVNLVEGSRAQRRRYQPDIQTRGLAA